jgi:uncharacterized protein
MAATISDPPLASVLAFCADDPVERVFLEDVARRGLGRFEAVEESGRLTALCHVGANVVPSGAGCSVFARAAARGKPRMIIGDERAVDELWDVARHRMARPRADRPGQPVYVIEEPPAPGDTGLRAATVGDLELLVPACARTHLEEIGVNPLRRDAEGFRWRTRAQIEEARSWLWEENGTIFFKAEASAWTPGAIQIQQVWVDPDVRGRKYAQRGMRDLVRLLLERVPRVCLFVRAENAAAIRVYEAIGMTHTNTYRSLLF